VAGVTAAQVLKATKIREGNWKSMQSKDGDGFISLYHGRTKNEKKAEDEP